jgi:hypothetical protein
VQEMVTSMGDQPGRNDQSNSGADLLADLQRWLIRSSAKNVRRELEDQVRRTLGGQRQDPGEVWDVATTEVPAEAGEAPECQWCPICRAARRMRESGPGLAGPLSGAGDAVATAVQDAISMLDSLLARSGGSRTGTTAGGDGTAGPAPGGSRTGTTAGGDGTAGPAPRPDSLAGEHGPSAWKPGDRLATTGIGVTDPWASATGAGDAADGTNVASEDEEQDGRGHGPSGRG